MTELEKYINLVRNGKNIRNVTSDDKLEFYALYKQFTIGNINTKKPTGIFNIKEKKKWDAWNKIKNLSKKEAKNKYIIKAKLFFK